MARPRGTFDYDLTSAPSWDLRSQLNASGIKHNSYQPKQNENMSSYTMKRQPIVPSHTSATPLMRSLV